MLKRYLLAPGPTPVPPEVLLAMARPMIHHRAPEFDPIFAEVREGLKWLFQTRNDVLMLAASGTGGMEGSVSNFLSPGDKALCINGGKFGERWGKLCKTFGVQAVETQGRMGTCRQSATSGRRSQERPFDQGGICAGQRDVDGSLS